MTMGSLMKTSNVVVADDNNNINDDDGVSVDSHILPHTTTTTPNGVSATEKDLERTTLARHESRVVARMRCAVIAVLLLTTVVVSAKVYYFTRHDQKQDFEKAFRADAIKILESFHNNVERRIETMDALSVAITSHAKATNMTFPNVTLPDFVVRYANTRVLTGSVFVNYLPYVTEINRLGWEAYQIENRHHFEEAYEFENSLRTYQDLRFNHSANSNNNISNSVEPGSGQQRVLQQAWAKQHDKIVRLKRDGSLEEASDLSGPYLPLWQSSPATPTKTILNIDALSHPIFARPYHETIRSGQAVINIATNLEGAALDETDDYMTLLLSLGQYRYDINEFKGDPTSAFSYPVFDSFDLTHREVVGLLATNFYWRLYFNNVLPANTRGIVCVLENTQNQTFTYRLDDTVTFLGNGDLHDTKYDYLETSDSVVSSMDETMSPKTRSYTSVDLNSDFCSYTIRVYPSHDTESQHVNHTPIIMTSIIVSVFLFTSLVFVLYTTAVQRRQDVVMDRAVASSAIVSSLFPSKVRDQIYQENAEAPADNNHVDDSDEVPSSKPIAEVFEHTTIMFADMSGFTLWSSTRGPVQVFELLETLYKAFDNIAVRRNVFKVETIGDCYVAVAGLPEPQEDHAVIMVKFAHDCMNKMNQLTAELANVLGPDTAQLTMRVGLHSGSVTGGVLRGQKSRFQLFGDTMNTASRMESNGLPGRIHVSQETAKELVDKGKAHWIVPREDKIVAKGKGEMRTFWVSVQPGSGSDTYKSEETNPHGVGGPDTLNGFILKE